MIEGPSHAVERHRMAHGPGERPWIFYKRSTGWLEA